MNSATFPHLPAMEHEIPFTVRHAAAEPGSPPPHHRPSPTADRIPPTVPRQPPRLLDQLRREIRVRHYSIRTEHTYAEWVVRFVRFHNLRHPREMGAAEVNQYLSFLATDCNIAARTQNQALCAIVFLYKARIFNPTQGGR